MPPCRLVDDLRAPGEHTILANPRPLGPKQLSVSIFTKSAVAYGYLSYILLACRAMTFKDMAENLPAFLLFTSEVEPLGKHRYFDNSQLFTCSLH